MVCIYYITAYNCNEAIGQGEVTCSDSGFSGNVYLGVISIAVEMETVTTGDVTEWEGVENEQERPKH